MSIERHNPDGLHATSGYHHVTVATGRRRVYLAGQCPLRPGADPGSPDAVTGGLDEQIDLVVANTAIALRSAGARPEDVVRTVVYVAGSDSHVLAEAWDRFAASEIGAAFSTASTLVGVTALGYRDQLVELDVTAEVEPGPG